MTLIERFNHFIKDTDIPITKLGKRIDLSATAINRWRNGTLNLKDETMDRIENYLSKFGY